MAEIRKFDPAVGNAIAQALRQAMGDPIRPNTPGEPADSPAAPAQEPSAQTTWFSLRIADPEE
ncbi:MAG: hypothetical protein QM804_04215 [Propionicimonas sp.]